MTNQPSKLGRPASVHHQDAVRALIKRVGEKEAANQLGISRSALPRVVAGLGVRGGTLALLREKFGAAS